MALVFEAGIVLNGGGSSGNSSWGNISGNMADQTDLTEALTGIDTNIESLQKQIDAQEGIGGYLTAYDFGTSEPTEDELNAYAVSQIENIDDPSELFNGTRVKNLYDGDLWILTNTPNTTPAVFEWTNNGQDTVSIATEDVAGVVKSTPDTLYGISVSVTGEMTLNPSTQNVFTTIENTIADKSMVSIVEW